MNTTKESLFGTLKKTARIAGRLSHVHYDSNPRPVVCPTRFGDAAEIINVMKSHAGLFHHW